MSFAEKLAVANGMSLGKVESPDFPCCAVIVKGGIPTIIKASMNGGDVNYPIRKQNIVEFRILAGGGNWVKYYIEFKDGKNAVITQTVTTEAAKSSGISMAPLERYIAIKERRSFPVSNEFNEEDVDVNEEEIEEEVIEVEIEESRPTKKIESFLPLRIAIGGISNVDYRTSPIPTLIVNEKEYTLIEIKDLKVVDCSVSFTYHGEEVSFECNSEETANDICISIQGEINRR